MARFLKAHWAELLSFGVLFGILLFMLAPNMTWINTDSDGVHYVYAAKNLYVSHKTSAPLFLLLGKAFVSLPFGSEFWRVGLISVLGTLGASIFVYLSIRHLVQSKALAILGIFLYGLSALVISQSTIVETYALTSMFMVGAYYFSIKSKWAWCAAMLGLGLAVHHLVGIALIVLLIAHRELRSPKHLAIMASGLLFYLYIPLSRQFAHSPDMWGNGTVRTFFGDNISTMMMLVGGLAIWDLPKRILDTVGLLGVSLGIGAIFIAWYCIRQGKWLMRDALFWLFALGVLYYMVDLAPQTYVYVMPSIAFGVIIAMVQLSKLRITWVYAAVAATLILSIVNVGSMSIGRTLDPNLSATHFYRQELPKIPDGQALMAQYGWQWAMVFPYNKNEGKNIIPIDIDTLVSPSYQEYLKSQGIRFQDNFDKSMALRQAFIANSIVALNENIWTTRTTEGKTYGAEVIKAKDYPELVNRLPTEPPAQWHWRPSNPYGIITGSIEIREWKFITFSNRNIRWYVTIIVLTLIPYLLFWKYWDGRKRKAEATT